jgi:hypothetical protein
MVSATRWPPHRSRSATARWRARPLRLERLHLVVRVIRLGQGASSRASVRRAASLRDQRADRSRWNAPFRSANTQGRKIRVAGRGRRTAWRRRAGDLGVPPAARHVGEAVAQESEARRLALGALPFDEPDVDEASLVRVRRAAIHSPARSTNFAGMANLPFRPGSAVRLAGRKSRESELLLRPQSV